MKKSLIAKVYYKISANYSLTTRKMSYIFLCIMKIYKCNWKIIININNIQETISIEFLTSFS